MVGKRAGLESRGGNEVGQVESRMMDRGSEWYAGAGDATATLALVAKAAPPLALAHKAHHTRTLRPHVHAHIVGVLFNQ